MDGDVLGSCEGKIDIVGLTDGEFDGESEGSCNCLSKNHSVSYVYMNTLATYSGIEPYLGRGIRWSDSGRPRRGFCG